MRHSLRIGVRPQGAGERWPWGWRLAHLLFALCVIMLVFTGMTLFYADSFWAPLAQKVFGGPTVTGGVHRFCQQAVRSGKRSSRP